MSLSPTDFKYVQDLLHERAAVVLECDKLYLANTRLMPLALREGFPNVTDFIAKVRSTGATSLRQKVVEALAINETSFFRDAHPFDALRSDLLPQLVARCGRERKLRVWSCGCSSGQEPYSLAMLFREHFPQASAQVSLLATDNSGTMLERARQGIYSNLEVSRGLAPRHLQRYFRAHGRDWQVVEELRRMVDFRPLNLAEPWPLLPPMDIVFLRNVLIYFDLPTKRRVLDRVRQMLVPGGVLFLGGAETTLYLDDAFERVQLARASYYRVRGR